MSAAAIRNLIRPTPNIRTICPRLDKTIEVSQNGSILSCRASFAQVFSEGAAFSAAAARHLMKSGWLPAWADNALCCFFREIPMAKDPLSDLGDPSHGYPGKIRRAKDNKSVWFARHGGSHWVKIPLAQVDKKKTAVSGLQHGRDVEHHVHLVMKTPQSDEGKAFAALAHLHTVPMASASGGDGDMCYDIGTHSWFPCPKKARR
jgi:hypothetical protein